MLTIVLLAVTAALIAGMFPMKAIRLSIGNLVAADTTLLAPATENDMYLVASDFNEEETLVAGDLTYASFTGSTAIGGTAGAQQVGIDPATNEQRITLLAPAGGWRWECTVAPGAPEMIYGYALRVTGAGALLAVKKFNTPVSISKVGDFIDLGAAEISMNANPWA